MKKVVVLNASPRADGACSEAVYMFEDFLNDKDFEFVKYDLYELNPAPCKDCGYCRVKNGCSVKDLDLFFVDFELAEYVVVFSPIYNNFFPGPMKNLLDRFQRYYSARFFRNVKPPIEIPKRVGIFVCSGTNDKISFDYMCETLRQSFTVLNGKIVSKFYLPSTDTNKSEISKNDIEVFINNLI